MFLKNYTSDVPVSQTIARIERVLIKCAVKGITKEYAENGEVLAIRFQIPGPLRDMDIRLPADADKAQMALWINYADGDKLTQDGEGLAWSSYKKKRKKDFREQAERTAWKTIQDWIEVQMSMIQMQQAEPAEVFLSYIYDPHLGTTLYQRLKPTNFAGLLPEKT